MEFFRFIQGIGEIENGIEERRQPRIRRRVLRDRNNPFEEYQDDQFKARFR